MKQNKDMDKVQEEQLEEAYERAGQELLKSSRKKPLPTWLTLWAPSTLGLIMKPNARLNKLTKLVLALIAIALIISFVSHSFF